MALDDEAYGMYLSDIELEELKERHIPNLEFNNSVLIECDCGFIQRIIIHKKSGDWSTYHCNACGRELAVKNKDSIKQ